MLRKSCVPRVCLIRNELIQQIFYLTGNIILLWFFRFSRLHIFPPAAIPAYRFVLIELPNDILLILRLPSAWPRNIHHLMLRHTCIGLPCGHPVVYSGSCALLSRGFHTPLILISALSLNIPLSSILFYVRISISLFTCSFKYLLLFHSYPPDISIKLAPPQATANYILFLLFVYLF